MTHRCEDFKNKLVWSEWALEKDLRRREARRVPFCRECGAERPMRTPREVQHVEFEAVSPVALELLSPEGKTTARELARRTAKSGPQVFAEGLLGLLGRRGIPASVAEEELLRFLDAGWVRLRLRVKGTRRELAAIRVLDLPAIEDAADPGIRIRREEAACRKEELADLDHPLAEEILGILSEEPDLKPEIVQILAGMAVHVADGDVLSERVFSARRLGDSKLLARHRGAIVQRIGDPARFGIREGVAITLIGGSGRIVLPGVPIDLDAIGPVIGLSREALLEVEAVHAGAAGLFVVENLAAFDACCRGEVADAAETLVVWSAGYPGRGVRSVVEAADAGGASVRVWADLDLDGVRIARLIRRWAEGAEPYRMSPEDLETAPVRQNLTRRAVAGIEADLERRPDALLSDTLRAILEAREWVEQEVFL